jgi:hypothetical protein
MLQIFRAGRGVGALVVGLFATIKALERRNHTRVGVSVEDDLSFKIQADSLRQFQEINLVLSNVKEALGPGFEVSSPVPDTIYIKLVKETNNLRLLRRENGEKTSDISSSGDEGKREKDRASGMGRRAGSGRVQASKAGSRNRGGARS